MHQFTSGMKSNFLIDAFRQAPAELRSDISHLVTDKIYWHNAGAYKNYALSSTVIVYSEQTQDELTITFKKGDTPLYKTTIKKWPENWSDEDPGREKMKMQVVAGSGRSIDAILKYATRSRIEFREYPVHFQNEADGILPG